MPWLRDWKSLRGPWLRTLVVLGLVVAVVAETPLRAVGGMPAWLTLRNQTVSSPTRRFTSKWPTASNTARRASRAWHT